MSSLEFFYAKRLLHHQLQASITFFELTYGFTTALSPSSIFSAVASTSKLEPLTLANVYGKHIVHMINVSIVTSSNTLSGISSRSFCYLQVKSPFDMPALCAARTFSLIPPTGNIRPPPTLSPPTSQHHA